MQPYEFLTYQIQTRDVNKNVCKIDKKFDKIKWSIFKLQFCGQI